LDEAHPAVLNRRETRHNSRMGAMNLLRNITRKTSWMQYLAVNANL
jgi:hypothetical protein